MERRDISAWPKELQEAYGPGVALIMDGLAEAAGRRLLGGPRDTDPPELKNDFSLPIIISYQMGQLTEEAQASLILELLGEAFPLNPHACYLTDYRIKEGETFAEVVMRLIEAMIRMRARLYPEVEALDVANNAAIHAENANYTPLPTFEEILAEMVFNYVPGAE